MHKIDFFDQFLLIFGTSMDESTDRTFNYSPPLLVESKEGLDRIFEEIKNLDMTIDWLESERCGTGWGGIDEDTVRILENRLRSVATDIREASDCDHDEYEELRKELNRALQLLNETLKQRDMALDGLVEVNDGVMVLKERVLPQESRPTPWSRWVYDIEKLNEENKQAADAQAEITRLNQQLQLEKDTEIRCDITNDKYYTKSQFDDFYGGLEEWNEAPLEQTRIAQLEQDAANFREIIGIKEVKIEKMHYDLESLQEAKHATSAKLRDLGTCWNIIRNIGHAGRSRDILRMAIRDANQEIKKGGIFREIKGSPHYQMALTTLECLEEQE